MVKHVASVAGKAPAHAPRSATGRLRLLRILCALGALACAVLLPFELGLVHLPASAPVVQPGTPQVVSVSNYPKTAVVGRTERFSVRLAGMPRALLKYELDYADNKTTEQAWVHADAQGYSSHTFRVTYRPRTFRETATIGVSAVINHKVTLQAFSRFAVQQP